MKQSQIALIIIGFILLALMATNPSIEDHRQAVIEEMKRNMSRESDANNKWEQVGQAIGMAFGQGIVEKAVTRDNYLLFSLTKVSFNGDSRIVGYGVLGKVWIKQQPFNEKNNSRNNNSEDTQKIKLKNPESNFGWYDVEQGKYKNQCDNSEHMIINHSRGGQGMAQISISYLTMNSRGQELQTNYDNTSTNNIDIDPNDPGKILFSNEVGFKFIKIVGKDAFYDSYGCMWKLIN